MKKETECNFVEEDEENEFDKDDDDDLFENTL